MTLKIAYDVVMENKEKHVQTLLEAAAKTYRSLKEAQEAADIQIGEAVEAARAEGMSWTELEQTTGIELHILRTRFNLTAKPVHVQRPTIEGYVGVTEAAKQLALTTSRVNALAREGKLEFKVVNGFRRFPIKKIEFLAEARRNGVDMIAALGLDKSDPLDFKDVTIQIGDQPPFAMDTGELKFIDGSKKSE